MESFFLIILTSLLEPFWPDGTGCARGFLSALDAAWMLRSWSLQVIVSKISIRIISPFSSQTHLGFWKRERTCTACSARPPMRISTRTSKVTLWTQEAGAWLFCCWPIPTFSFCFSKGTKIYLGRRKMRRSWPSTTQITRRRWGDFERREERV